MHTKANDTMIYLEKFIFPDVDHDTLIHDHRLGSFYDEHSYPFHLTSSKALWSLDFEPITILYGNNGSGKSTILNVISQKLCANRTAMFNSSPYFDEYVKRCHYKASERLAGETLYDGYRERQKYDIANITTVITSDDIFHMMQEQRLSNDMKLHKSRFLHDDYYMPEDLAKHINFETGYNVEKFNSGMKVRKAKSFNQYLLNTIGKMERGFSNGETALMKLSEAIEQPGIYLLDEPENSMSCDFQMKLASIIQHLARRGGCQFIIASHSPFILSLEGAKIYNLDHFPVNICEWWELENMRSYFKLFEQAREHFL